MKKLLFINLSLILFLFTNGLFLRSVSAAPGSVLWCGVTGEGKCVSSPADCPAPGYTVWDGCGSADLCCLQTMCTNTPAGQCIPATDPCPDTTIQTPDCFTGVCCGWFSRISPSCQADEIYIDIFHRCLTYGESLGRALNWAIVFAALLALVRLTIGGIQYIFSRGQPDKMESAQATMTSAIFGLILVFIAWLLIQFLGDQTPDWWKIDFFSITNP